MGNFDRGNRSGGDRGGNRFGGGNGGYRGGNSGGFNRGGGNFRGNSGGGFRGGRGGGGNGGWQEKFEAVCDSCGKLCEVPFKPTGEKPVYCNDCYKKINKSNNDIYGNGNRSRSYDNQSPYHPSKPGKYDKVEPAAGAQDYKQLLEEVESIHSRLDEVVEFLNNIFLSGESEDAVTEEITVEEPEKAKKTSKKKSIKTEEAETSDTSDVAEATPEAEVHVVCLLLLR